MNTRTSLKRNEGRGLKKWNTSFFPLVFDGFFEFEDPYFSGQRLIIAKK